MTRPGRGIVVFLDGVGLGPSDPSSNPMMTARIPTLRRLARGVPAGFDERRPIHDDRGGLVPLDATLGVAGTPGSGTGHAAFVTGQNAPALHGAHFGPWVPVGLRAIVERENLLLHAKAQGLRVCFANAYPRALASRPRPRLETGITLAARSAELLHRHAEELVGGSAVASQIVNSRWRAAVGGARIPDVSPEEAGGRLARLAAGFHLTLFAHYDTDVAGHRGGLPGGRAALERVDRFLGGLLAEAAPETLLVVASDHGNLEDIRGGHTSNPALGLVDGPGGGHLVRRLRRITDPLPALLDHLLS